VVSYIHGGGRIGVLVEVNCETDFVARNEDFQAFTREVALQIAAMNPQFVRKEEVSKDVIDRERDVLLAKAKESGKPEPVVQKMVDGQISKWMKEICLLDQAWVKDPDKTIDQVQQELIAKIGENIKVRRFMRYELGEGLEKKKDDFAAEVAKQAGLTT
jgi:elongation factor Ts